MRHSMNVTKKISVLTLSLTLLVPQTTHAGWSTTVSNPGESIAQVETTTIVAQAASSQNDINLRYQKDIFGRSFEFDKDGKKSRFEKTNRKKYIANISEVMVNSVARSRKAAKLAQKGETAAAALLSIQDGAEFAAPVSDDKYNVTIQGYLKVNKNTAFVRIPLKLNSLLRDSNACDLGAVGPCIVVAKDHKGKAEAFMVGSANVDGKFHVVRKEIRRTMENRRQMNALLEIENGVMTVYSFAQNSEDVMSKINEANRIAQEKSNTDTTTTEQQNGWSDSLSQEELNAAQAAKQGKIEVLTSEQDIQAANKEMSEYAKHWDVSVRQKYEELLKNGSSQGYCVVGGWLKTNAIQLLFLRLNFTEKFRFELPSDERPLMKGKGRLLCHMNDKSVVRIKIEAKMFSDLSVGAMFGTLYFGSIGIGIANGPLDLIQTRLDDNTLLPYREWAFFPFLNVDAAYILGIGASMPGFSSGRHQSPILNLFTGRFGVGAVGARWGIFEKGRIGFDPDDL